MEISFNYHQYQKEKNYNLYVIDDVFDERFACDFKAQSLEEKYAGVYKHAACHMDKVQVWSDRSIEFEAIGGWHDAGDYGRYITPAAVTIGHLLYAFLKYPLRLFSLYFLLRIW